MTHKKGKRGYRRTPEMGRPKKPKRFLKRFIGRVTFDQQLERALKDEQRRREKLGEKGARSVVMRDLLIKGLRELGHDPGETDEESSG